MVSAASCSLSRGRARRVVLEFDRERVEIGACGCTGAGAVIGELGVDGGGGLGERDDLGGAAHERGVQRREAREHFVDRSGHDGAPFGRSDSVSGASSPRTATWMTSRSRFALVA